MKRIRDIIRSMPHLPAASGIYRITNTQTGEFYVGASKVIQKRMESHMGQLLRGEHHCLALQESFAATGLDVFSADVLELCDVEALARREQFWINDLKPTLNTCVRAGGGHQRQRRTIIKPAPSLRIEIKRHRIAAGMNQGDVAKKLGVATGTYSGWERGKFVPRADLFPKLAKVLGIDPYEMTGMMT